MEQRTLQTLFEAFNQLTVLVVGDVMLDRYIWGDVERISPEAPVPVVNVKRKNSRLGGASNVTLNIRALGASPILCTVIGDDRAGHQLLDRMDKHMMTTKGIVVSNSMSTTVKTRIIANYQHVVRIDEEKNKPLSQEVEDSLFEQIKKHLPQCQAVIFEDYDKGVISPPLIKKTTAMAKKRAIPVIADPKKRNFLSYEGATLIKPNLKELSEVLNRKIDPTDLTQLAEASRELKSRLHADVMITLAERGMFLNYQNQEISVPAHHCEIVDVSGAGDSVAGIVSLCLALKVDPYTIASLSNLGGGLSCRHVGVVPIDKMELLKTAIQLQLNGDGEKI